MKHYDAILVTLVFALLLGAEFLFGIMRRRRKDEWLIELLALVQLAIIKPVVLLLAFAAAQWLFPAWEGGLADLPFWLGFLVVFLPDDLSHYWVHRLAHEHPSIWGLHRTHHTASVYQTSVAFRENWLWFWVMPGFWWAGAMVYFGLLDQVLLAAAIIGVHNVFLHTGFTADRLLYRDRRLSRLMRCVEYVINTPSLHRGHHGIGHHGVPSGNYAQTLFVWDVLFGTARFQDDRLPERYGTFSSNSMKQPWYYQLWWPIAPPQPLDEKGEIEQPPAEAGGR